MYKKQKGFTLIELLIVIAILAILGTLVFVALDPLVRFKDARDAARWSGVAAIIAAIKTDQVDNGGYYLTAVSNMSAGNVYMIGKATSGCTVQNSYCDTNISGDANCVDLSGLVTEGYLGEVPVSPNGLGSWDENITGYTVQKASTGILTVRACESENTDEIKISR